MKRTVADVLDWLEHPENQHQIQFLFYLKYLANIKIEKQLGFMEHLMLGVLVRVIKKNMAAVLLLSECKTAADVAGFKQTPHYANIKNQDISSVWDGRDLSYLKNLEP
jgi:hypothetical protein